MEKKKIIHASNTLVFESILVINVREGDDLKSLIYRDCKIPTLQAGIRAESAIWNASQAAISPFSQCVLLPRCNEYAFEEFRLIETSPTFVAREKKKEIYRFYCTRKRRKKRAKERSKERLLLPSFPGAKKAGWFVTSSGWSSWGEATLSRDRSSGVEENWTGALTVLPQGSWWFLLHVCG